jgi:BolA protein
MSLASKIEAKLTAALNASSVRVVDDSDAHAGHGASGVHVHVVVVSPAFAGKPTLVRHRLVYAALAEEMKQAIHALQITARAPDEPV